MLGRNVARLAFEVRAEADHLVAGVLCDLDGRIERSLRLCDHLELRAGKRGVARLAAFIRGIFERAPDGIVDREIVPRHQRAGVCQRARIRHRRPGCDRGGIVMRHVRYRQRHDLGGALSGAGQPAALDPRQMLADDVHLADRRARTQQRAVHLLLLCERNAVGRRDPVRRAAAGQQHQQQVVSGCLGGETQRFVGGFQSGFVGYGMAGLDHPDPPRRHAVAVARGGKAGQPCGIEPERVEVMPFGGRRHRRCALAGGKADHAAFRCGPQMRREHDVGMRGRDSRIKDRTQEGTSVGHDAQRRLWTGTVVIHPIAAKENPRGMFPRGLSAREMGRLVFEITSRRRLRS